MCYLNQVKQCKTSTMLYLNYIKQNTTSVLCFLAHVKQNANNAMYLLNHVIHKTINEFCLNQFKHNAINAMLFESCKPKVKIFLNYSKHNSNSTLGFTTHINQNENSAMYILNHLTHKTINEVCFIECKHSASR